MDLNLIDYEQFLIKQLFTSNEVRDKLVPFLDPEYFDSTLANSKIITSFNKFYQEFNQYPNAKELVSQLSDESTYEAFKTIMQNDFSNVADKFIQTEAAEYFRQKMIMNTVYSIAEGIKENGSMGVASVPDKLRDALSFSFDTSVGLDFSNDVEKLYDELHDDAKTISTGLPKLDRMIKGGFKEKTLTLILGGTNVGKTLAKCALACNTYMQNKNVLYVSFEMSEAKIAERLVANIYDVKLDDIEQIPKDRFIGMFNKIKSTGRLFVKEYPTRGANTNNIRNLVQELAIKKKFVPEIIFVDYLGIMLTNQRSQTDNTNSQLKVISEELRGLAVELGVPIVSGAQTNRGGMGVSDLDLTDIADSIGQTMTSDIIIALTQTEEMLENNLYKAKLLKNRQGGKGGANSLLLKVDYPHMRLEEAPEETDEIGGDELVSTAAAATTAISDAISLSRKTKREGRIEYE
jgi:replicative DNA helicase